ncbi:hypothetical protein KIN20_030914 [Parelaphostrongylus tenuis]|uniref:Uncharacterized protein n=1 Tax=Parelaphostrongylus tenuis TaxID=148309 RepID=A0AAD5R4P4_PARTN|nr:hypothetical protein KIN20_030914 [Parelaphostrongylus tenuis]
MPLKEKGIMTSRNTEHDCHVKFKEDVKTEKPQTESPEPAPSQISIPPPTLPCQVKDEIELLRAGLLNKHGDHLKHAKK